MPVQQLVAEILFVRTSYVKKIIEDCSNSEETVKLLRFSCWENPQFSSTVLSELLWQVNVLWKDEQDIFYVSTRAKVPIIYVLWFCRWLIPTPTNWGLTWTCCYRSCSLRTPGRHTGQTHCSGWKLPELRGFKCDHSLNFPFPSSVV